MEQSDSGQYGIVLYWAVWNSLTVGSMKQCYIGQYGIV